MKYERTGVILCTENYDECVRFYGKIMSLPLLFQLDETHSVLTCFDMGGSYLMIEHGGTSIPQGKTLKENPVILRFNVVDVDEAAEHLKTQGVKVKIRREVWGTVADFLDPDGNRCSLRDEVSFHGQIQ